ncbi:MAG: FeoC like transcriptional regulator [Thermotogota bacterium]|nr:FeoC like transcriptional regulator [Thermotogota bacterium]MDK2864459.1 FeoC like transcriptional regulator [Thermotogota bacterium]HCZ05518.1 hypothetical protein [Thermotogota bacterium]
MKDDLILELENYIRKNGVVDLGELSRRFNLSTDQLRTYLKLLGIEPAYPDGQKCDLRCSSCKFRSFCG